MGGVPGLIANVLLGRGGHLEKFDPLVNVAWGVIGAALVVFVMIIVMGSQIMAKDFEPASSFIASAFAGFLFSMSYLHLKFK